MKKKKQNDRKSYVTLHQKNDQHGGIMCVTWLWQNRKVKNREKTSVEMGEQKCHVVLKKLVGISDW